MNKKKNKKKKLGSLLLLLFLTVIMLATSTYAWFTANKTVTVSNIDVHVSASSGLQISTDAVNWKTLVASADITTGYSATNPADDSQTITDRNMLPVELAAVSTIGQLNNGYMKMYTGTVGTDNGEFVLTAETASETRGTTGNFVAFDLFLKTDTVEDLYLSVGSGVTATDGQPDKNLQNAARIGLVIEGTQPATSDQYTLVNNFSGSDVKIIEPNYDSHTQYGITQANMYYTDYEFSALTEGDGNAAVSYDGVYAPISSGILLANTNATDNPDYFNTVETIKTSTAFSKASAGQTNLLLYPSFPAGVTKVRVYMWIEGQDVDCENNASGAYLSYALTFTQTP